MTLKFEGMVETGADITIISSKSWLPDWTLQEVTILFQGVGTFISGKTSCEMA